MVQKLIIDADPGIGDALAIVVALADPELDVVGLTATAGCVSQDLASRNVHAIVEHLDPRKWPRIGSADVVAGPPWSDLLYPGVTSSALNGPAGLGDYDVQVADLHNAHPSPKLMIDLVRDDPNEITLLTLGPLVNVEMAAERAPEFLGLLNGLVCLGGSISAGGDVTAAAEFNIHAAPTAARNVLRSAATKTLVPLDVSSRPVLTFDQFDRVTDGVTTPAARFLKEILPYAFRAYHEHLGVEGVPLKELTALAAITRARMFEREEASVDVETSGELTRGMTVFDQRRIPEWPSNIDVVTDVDVQGVLDYLTTIVKS